MERGRTRKCRLILEGFVERNINPLGDGLTTASEFQAAMYAEGVEMLRSSAVPSSYVRLHVPGHVVGGLGDFFQDQSAPAEGPLQMPARIFAKETPEHGASSALGVIAMCLVWRRAKTSVEIPEPVSRVLLWSETESKRKRASSGSMP